MLTCVHSKQRDYHQKYTSLWVPDLSCHFVHAQSVIRTRISSLYVSQPSSVILCIQNSDFRTRSTSVHGSQTSPVIFCIETSEFTTRITSLYGSQTSHVDLCMQNSVLSTRIIRVPTLICGLFMQNSVIIIRSTRLYEFQTSAVILCMKKAWLARPSGSVTKHLDPRNMFPPGLYIWKYLEPPEHVVQNYTEINGPPLKLLVLP